MTISSHKSYVYKNKRQDQNGVESSLYQSLENSKVPPPPYKTLETIFPVAKREERPPLQQLFHFVIVPLFELKLKVNIKDESNNKKSPLGDLFISQPLFTWSWLLEGAS